MANKIIWKIVLDFLVLACVGISLLLVTLWARPFERGYFENDMSIRLPFKQESIHEGVLGGVGFAFMIAAILITEITRDCKGKNTGEKFLGQSLIPGWLWESYTAIGVFTFGAACQQLTTALTKNIIGRLRPHFYDLCRPTPSGTQNDLGYIESFTCSNTNTSQLTNMRLSFPSAHSSFAMYTAVFFICYIQVKGKWRGSKLLRHSIQFTAILAAWYVGLTRVQENYHHWSDVTAGFLIGAAYAVLVFVYILKPNKYGPLSWDEPAPQNVLPRPVLAR